MPKPPDPLTGAFRIGSNLTLADIWIGLHSDAQTWQRAAFAADTMRQRAAIDENTMALFAALSACPAARWQAFVEAQGVTQIGAVALSWCEDAALAQVADLFLFDAQGPADIDHRAARGLNPALLPKTRSLSQMAETAHSDVNALVVMCLGDPSPLVFDVSATWLNDLPAVVGAILLERYDPTISVVAPDIISTWKAAA